MNHLPNGLAEQMIRRARQTQRVAIHIDPTVTPAIFRDRSGDAIGGIYQDRRLKCVDCGGAAFALDCPDRKPRAGCLDCGHSWETQMTTARLRKHLANQRDLQATIDAIWELVEQTDAGPVGVGGSVPTADLRRVLEAGKTEQ